MNHLEAAKRFAHSTDGVGVTVDWAQVNATLAITHALIARVEQVNKAVGCKEVAAERAALAGARETYLPQKGIDKVPGGM